MRAGFPDIPGATDFPAGVKADRALAERTSDGKVGAAMGARQKLNGAFFNGAVLLGATFGVASQSYIVAFCVFALLVGVGLHSGDIRPTPKNRG